MLGIDKVVVDFTRVFYGIKYGWLGDFVEHYALGLFGSQAKHFIKVPSNSFPLAVFIGGKPHHVGIGCGLFQLLDKFLFFGRNFVNGFEPVGSVDAEIFFVQISDVPVTRHHFEVFAQEFLYRLGFGRRFDYY